MKIIQWLGFNEDSSQYLLRRGELRALVNLQPRRPGMLVSRDGLIKLYGKYDDERIIGLYRRDTIVGNPSDFLCFQRSFVERVLSSAQIAAKEIPAEEVLLVRRIQGFQERVIAQLKNSPEGLSSITNFCVAEDRFGRMFLFFGHGAEPLIYRPDSLGNIAIPMGLEAPKVAPVVVPTDEGYFIETIDVVSGGGGYYAPPSITVDGGSPDRPAKVKGIVRAGNLVGVDVMDGGANFKSFPKVTVGTDKVGGGFRAVGVLETDPGVQGFVSTTAGVVSGTAPTAQETVGEFDGVLNNRIMYRASSVAATARTVAQSNSSNVATTSMVLDSVAGISPSDIVTVQGSSIPAAFSSTGVIRVMSINAATKTLTLSKSWIPGNNVSYLVQFRKDTTIGYAPAEWNPTTRRFRASVPLRTTRGTGSGAEATLEFSPAAYSFGLGAFSLAGYATPSGGVEPARFAFKQVGWDSYINNEYWQGSFQNVANSAENQTYAGLQASGQNYVFGWSGTSSTRGRRGRTINRRADIYWPDYSHISVWLCTGNLSDNINQWTRVDAKVYDGDTANPYAIVDLRPTASSKATTQSGKMSYSTLTNAYNASSSVRYPQIKILLKSCPDAWVTDEQTDTSFSYNLPISAKDAPGGRIGWWHRSGPTPRPVVDLYRNQDGAISWESIEVLDKGAGWENGATFAIRIHQANAYDQRTDFNTAVREAQISGAHQPFSLSSRYAQFVFQATEPDDQTPEGPPAILAGSQFVDVAGAGYRANDTAEVVILKRPLLSSTGTQSVSFEGVIVPGGASTEYTFVGGVQQAGALVYNFNYTTTQSKIRIGDIVACDEPDVLLPNSAVLTKGANTLGLDKMDAVAGNPDALIYGTISGSSATGIFFDIKTSDTYATAATTTPQYAAVGRKLVENSGSCTLRVLEVTQRNGGASLRVEVVGGTLATGNFGYRPIFGFTTIAGLSEGQKVVFTAEQIIAGTGEQRVSAIRIVSGGRDYFSPPTILVRGGGNGYGLSVKPTVDSGKITACEILDPGRAYTAAPELYTSSTAAVATPVMRPTMRGVYRCAYRFADRSETVVANATITGVSGDSPSVLTLSTTEGMEPGMLLESDRLPHGTKVVGVNGNQVDISQPANGEGFLSQVVIENPGTGYAQNEAVTATVSGATGASFGVVLSANTSGSYSVSSAAVTAPGSVLFGLTKVPVVFSAPAAGGSPATGYAIVTQFNPSDTYSKSVVVRDMTRPVAYSSFSPIIDVDAGPNDERQHCSKMEWTLSGVTPPTRADMVELWRTSADQSLVFYRLEAYGIPTANGVDIVGADALNDEELFDPDRPNYAAMPVVLPNGNLNAYRFGKPRKDMAVCVAFQDRLWYGVSTSGKDANTLFYSEFDEFESCPDANDLPIQNNQRSTDSLTALVPFGSMLLAMQHAHTYAVTYNTDPGIDGSIQMISHRGCLHQRCWDMHQNILYAADENGIYAMDRSGQVSAISAPIREWFSGEQIDFSKRESFFLTVCPRTQILRFFCCKTSQSEETPAFALCYDIERQTWWSEQYPNSFCSAVTGRPGVTRINNSILGGTDGNLYEMSGEKDHANQSITHCVVTDGGKGYRRSPRITCPSSRGVQLKGVVSEGRLVDVLVLAGGWDCKWGIQLLTQDGRQLMGHDSKLIQGVEYAPIVLDIDPPEGGGAVASAVAHFSVTQRLVREVTVSQGDGFVRISARAENPVEWPEPPYLATHNGLTLTAVGDTVFELPDLLTAADGDPLTDRAGDSLKTAGNTASVPVDGLPIQTEPPAVEIGMEAIGDYLPLNCFVSRIEGLDIYLEHPDGTPATILGGAERLDLNADGYKESGGTPATVFFRKPFNTHIPFRLATGAMQLLNEDNVNRGGDGLIDRSVTLVYAPTESKKEVEVIQYYNDSSTPRPNVMRRSRGGNGGFEHRQDSASTVLNMERSASSLADATGVATAMFAGRVYTDATGEDQHIQVELHGRPHPANGGGDMTPHKFVMHSMTVSGVLDNGE